MSFIEKVGERDAVWPSIGFGGPNDSIDAFNATSQRKHLDVSSVVGSKNLTCNPTQCLCVSDRYLWSSYVNFCNNIPFLKRVCIRPVAWRTNSSSKNNFSPRLRWHYEDSIMNPLKKQTAK